ncbi:MAG TPA: response regulator [Thermodesulfobacteriota bacterium]|nr:response regulator [Thermodesulfobacteriota bacterium]
MKSILIIKDQKIISLDIKTTLKDAGYTVDSALDGVEGIEKIKQKKTYDLIILNNSMPRMTGKEFYIKVLALSEDLANEVMFVTGRVTEFIKSTGNPFLIKPFSPEQLMEEVKRLTD